MTGRTAFVCLGVSAAVLFSGITVRNVARSRAAGREELAALEAVRTLQTEGDHPVPALLRSVEQIRADVENRERETFATEGSTWRVQTALRLAARELGIAVTRLEANPSAGAVAVTVSGSPTAAINWISAAERAVSAEHHLCDRVEIAGGRDNIVEVTIACRSLRRDDPPLAVGFSRRDLEKAAALWPKTNAAVVAAAFRRPTGTPVQRRVPANGTPPLSDRARPSALGTGSPAHILGTVSTDGEVRYALRFSAEQTILVLGIGEEALGWQLSSDGESSLILQKEGASYVVPQ